MSISEKIRDQIRDIQDFPKPGILFKDIMPIFSDPELCKEIVQEFVSQLSQTKIDAIACIESRGFFFGMLLAQELKVPFIPIRKKGKLPYKTVSVDYELEYGSETMEMQIDAVKLGQNILIHDDILATGGTALAASKLIEKAQGKIVGFAFIIGLRFLNGEDKLRDVTSNIISLVEY